MQNKNPFISIVVPCYNEEDVIDIFLEKIFIVLKELDRSYEIVFVNDGSRDKTLEILKQKAKEYDEVRVISLSRNFGKEAALSAGLDMADGEVVVPIDVDLQDPPELILDFVKKYEEGYDVVVGKRVDRTTDSFAKRISAEFFYKIHNKISDIEIPHNVGDYRLMSRRVVDELKQLPESQRFMKGLFAWLGFKTAVVEYKRDSRAAGETSFNGWKLWNFALDGITSFSTAPLRVWFYIGLVIAFISFIYGSWIILKTLIFGVDSPGYASMITVVLFLGGIQLMGIGILGEYIGRIYIESKNRPVYIIEDEY
ncbi:glycosyltransferase family 2 protein [Sulfurimonas autotrophica]|uniref:Glycosyl transferase family 2 n=1 Tax=Sulfurimonas autotrophica (strain ATCC BAA-671 / DSM 16294 / JCM 11897 / OK10) TaxID=563040 RepID=E0UV20_SULAO|nr:glycosyltransferase family 2 protein [Sulfurimonas autotrophica]ADN09602.1 glycosyl transferase family 2 [Sulfurimonas autotrophica DSM 16294]